MTRRMTAAELLLLTTFTLAPAEALAGNYAINPTRVTLDADHNSAMLTLNNRGNDPIQFQITAFAWTQSEDGKMAFAPTDDLIIYPTVFEVPAGQKRLIRVGTHVAPGDQEAAYRIYVDELPALEDDTGQVGVRVLARMGIPIFLAPDHPHVHGEISEATLDGDQLHVRVLNDGDVHVMLEDVAVFGLDDRGRTLWEKHRADWYLLPDGGRALSVDLPMDACENVSSLQIKAATDRATWTRSLDLEEGLCPR